MTTEYTAHYRLPIPDFDVVPWHQAWEDSLRAVDEALYLSTITTAPMWVNLFHYFIGDMAIDAQQGTLWICKIEHTAAAAPTTFAADRTARPTLWQGISTLPTYRGEWVAGTTYNLNDFVHSGTQYSVAAVAHVASANYAADVAAGKWTVLIDVGSTSIGINGLPFATASAAATIDLGAIPSSRVNISGSGFNISSFGTTPNLFKIINFGSGGNTLMYNPATMVLPNASNFVGEAGDIIYMMSNAAGAWTSWGYIRRNAITTFNDTKQPATQAFTGVVELATDAETRAMVDATRAVTPLNLAALGASGAQEGFIAIASNAEARAMAVTNKALVPANLTALNATQTDVGFVELATNAEAQALAATGLVVTPANLGAVTATQTARGLVELATPAETATGADGTRAVTPLGLAGMVANTTDQGMVRYATGVETKALSISDAAVTPDGLGQTLATTTAKGIVELATASEAQAMVDATRALTPANLVDAIANKASMEAESTNRLVHSNFARNAPGNVKVWGACDGGTNLLHSYNVIGITDGGVGILTVDCATAFVNTVYTVMATPLVIGADRSLVVNAAPLAGRFVIAGYNTAGTAADPTRYYFAGMGHQ